MKLLKTCLIIALSILSSAALAAQITITLYKVAKTGHGASVGTVVAKDTQYGLLLTPKLHGLPPGLHGFHVHQNPNCSDFGKAAGGHFDPKHTGKHLGPYDNNGHLGDLPALYVNQQGKATLPVLAPRLKVSDLKGHSLMIHQGGDNYSDIPKPLGGGGPRMDCGVIK